MTEMISAADMIGRVFRNIDPASVTGAGTISAIWDKVVRGIKNSRDEFYGDKLASHSEVVDFKNGQLLVQADHPGWIQALQLYSKFIIRGMNMNMPDFKVDSMVFRLKGSNSTLFNTYEEELKKAQEEMNRKTEAAEKETQAFLEKSGASGTKEAENDLPDDFKAILAGLENTVLTNSKDK